MKAVKALIPYFKAHAATLGWGLFFMLLQNYSYMEVPHCMKQILDEINGANRWVVIRRELINFVFFTVLLSGSLFMMRKLIISASRKIEYELRRNIYDKLLALDYLFYRENETGDLMSRCTNDLTHVRTLLGPGVMYIPNSLSRLILFLPVLVGVSGPLMAVIGALMSVLVIATLKLLPLLRPLFRQIQETMGTMNNRVWQAISGISTIKGHTAEESEIRRFKGLNDHYVEKQMAVVRLQGFLRPLFLFIFSVIELVILWMGGDRVIDGRMTLGELLQFNVMIGALTFPILALGWMMSLLQQGLSAMERILHILEKPVTTGGLCACSDCREPLIVVNGLTYHYPGDPSPVLKDIHMAVEPGRTIGITGPVGSGKSTLVNILTGLLRPLPGQVFINGNDICDIDMTDYYRQMAVVSQDPFLFSRTVAENIALGPREVSMETIRRSAENAGLKEDIRSFPDGYDQAIGERGITLSGGQKQRVAIARALSKSVPLLVMDDPLSSVDSRTEEQILQSLKQHHCFRTLILVSHRISVLKIADEVYVLDDGTVAERGSHLELMEQKGLYSRLALMQQMESPDGPGELKDQ